MKLIGVLGILGGALYLSLLPFDPIHSVNFSLLCSLVFGASIVQDRDLSEYIPSQSSTSKQLSCSHRLCDTGPNCKNPNQSCPYSINYYTESTSSSGLLVEDIIHLASGGDDTLNTSVKAPVIIGCGMKQSGGYLDGVAPDGLLGLGLQEISVPSFLAKAGLIQNSFSMCFNEDDSGRIFFGDQGPATQQSAPFLKLNGNYTTYIVGVEVCCVGASCLKQSSFSALVDSGTSFTFLPDDVFEMIAEEFDTQVNASRSSFEGYSWKYCYKTRVATVNSSQDLPKIPSLRLIFPQNNSFLVQNHVFMIYGIQGVIGFCLAIQPADGDIGTIGQNFMTGYRVVFDRENLKLGWSRGDEGDGKTLPLTPSGTPRNPLPTNEQQSTPGGHAVSPAVAVNAPSKPSAASSQLISTRFCFLKWVLPLYLLHRVVSAS
ncbi:aspartic proteinase-like protein 1 isoform X2 [Populus alba x Populus x berolinensis]|uniref:Aspartic proteinase-like protein 1 isoform X2 n=1 Tax=Populus alba x Populus x berolinensis TaxID=444605 RepID=A0AAD6QUC7_9ROSI|nr:aspartic proteinase-like protein 1 isoform X2 [Populus alba x Populus x berolinensis]